MECKWVVEAVENSKIVRLSFPSFHVKNSSTRHTADCVAVYDGRTESVGVDQNGLLSISVFQSLTKQVLIHPSANVSM